MDNETFLICTYFASGIICTAIGVFAYLFLRGPIRALTGRIGPSGFTQFVNRAFAPTTILTALVAFLAVNYFGGGCSSRTYREVVSDRSLMLLKNQSQIRAALNETGWAVWIWIAIVSIVVVATAIRKRSSEDSRT